MFILENIVLYFECLNCVPSLLILFTRRFRGKEKVSLDSINARVVSQRIQLE